MATRLAPLLSASSSLLLAPSPALRRRGRPTRSASGRSSPSPRSCAASTRPTPPGAPGHRGVDLRGSPGQPVRAALPGRVTWAGSLAGRGVVVVDHGATRTTYEPVDRRRSTSARAVAAGDRLGTARRRPGRTACPRACLHWGWIEGETYLDPLRLVGAGPVRLLPLWRDEPVAARSPARTPRLGAAAIAQARGCACW